MSPDDPDLLTPLMRAAARRDGVVVWWSDALRSRLPQPTPCHLSALTGGWEQALERLERTGRPQTVPCDPVEGFDVHLSHSQSGVELLVLPADERLTAARQDAANATRQLEHLLRIAAHDLGEPMRKVDGFARLLQHAYADTLDDTAKDWLAHLIDGAARGRQVLDRLVAVEQAGHSTHPPTDIALAALVRGLWPHPDRLHLRIDHALVAPADPFVAALSEVLDNAARFVLNNTAPRIEVSTDQTCDGIEVRIRDFGIGIAPDARERAFDALVRLNGRSAYPGIGLGLTRARRLLASFGGRAWFESPAHGPGVVAVLFIPVPLIVTSAR